MNNKIKIGILITLIVLIVGLLTYDEMMGPVVKNDKTQVMFSIKEGENSKEILNNLETKSLIKSPMLSSIYLKHSGLSDFKTGTFKLNKSMNLNEILVTLNTTPDSTSSMVTFPEGIRAKDFAKIISENTNVSSDQFLEALNDESLINELKQKYEVVKKFEMDDKMIYKLEGLLYPDTYKIEYDFNANQLVEFFVKTFNTKYTENKTLFDKSDLSMNEIITLASMVENEAKTFEDRQLVAGIFMNRIKQNMPLGSDVTTYYGLQLDMSERDLTSSELAQVNGYNTRAEMQGLPVGPICNPSIDALKAAIEYVETDNLYFVSDKNGKIYATKTYDEHEAIIKELKDTNMWFEY